MPFGFLFCGSEFLTPNFVPTMCVRKILRVVFSGCFLLDSYVALWAVQVYAERLGVECAFA